jgi:non-specific serine/threonine protein kinase
MSLADSVVEYLRDRSVLVILDNCEHVLRDAGRLVSAMLGRCPQVRLLATSREGLAVGGEQLVAVPSLAVPDSPEEVTTADAVQLFTDRAVAVRPGFRLEASTSPRWQRSADGWTECPSPSSWPQPECPP